jgi:WD40 repeat protein
MGERRTVEIAKRAGDSFLYTRPQGALVSMKFLRISGLAASVILSVVGCSSSSTSPGPTPPPGSGQHLYVTDKGTPSTIFVFNTPITASSTPAVTLLTTGNAAGNPCFDNANHIFVPMANDHTVQVFNLPLTASSTPAFTLAIGSTGRDCHFDASGDLYVQESAANQIEVFQAPVMSGSTVHSTLTNAALQAGYGIWTDPSGDVFAATALKAALEFSPFPANTPTASFGPASFDCFGLAIGPSGSLYIANATANGTIDVYDPPFSNSSTKNAAKTIVTTLTSYVSYMAFDSLGNLYVGGDDVGVFHVLEYTPPYSGVPIDLSRGATRVEGTAIGP